MTIRGSEAQSPTVDCLRRYQAAIIDFGDLALSDIPLLDLFQEACENVAATVGIEHAKVLRFLPDEGDLLVAAGVGWKPGVVGHATLPASMPSPPGRAFLTGEAVAIDDLPNDASFEWSKLLREHGIRSLVNVPLKTAIARYGVLEIDGTEPHRFTDDCKVYLLGMAKLLASAVERRHAEEMARSAAAQAATAAAERELLLQELRHRVANNLQVVSGLLYKARTAAKTPHSKELIDSVMKRIEAMIDAHWQLSTADAASQSIPLAPYLTRLCAAMAQQHAPRIRIETEIADSDMAMDRAVTVGLIINEVVTNALKHAFPGEATGTVRVELATDAHQGEGALTVSDTGRGMADMRKAGMGLRLIDKLVGRVGGTVTRGETPGGGTQYRVRFPLAPGDHRGEGA
jgi:two-component sensor histidine kinase